MPVTGGHAVKLEHETDAGKYLRLDVGDTDALRLLAVEGRAEALASLLGGGTASREVSGCLTLPTIDTSTLGAVTVSAFTMFVSRYDGAGRYSAQHLVYDEGNPWQSPKTLDLSPYETTGTPWLWAQRTEVLADEDDRFFWEEGGPDDGASETHKTRIREGCEFAVGDTAPGDDWFRWARVRGWAGSVPQITILSPFDLGDTGLVAGPPAAVRSLFGVGWPIVSVATIIQRLLTEVARTKSQDYATDGTDWLAVQPGVKQVDTRLAVLEPFTGVVLAAAVITGASETIASGALNVASVSRSSAGNYEVTLSLPSGSVPVTAVVQVLDAAGQCYVVSGGFEPLQVVTLNAAGDTATDQVFSVTVFGSRPS